MTDLFLEAHRVGPAEYDLTNSHPFAIRDQLIRARLLVERAHASGGMPNSTMLIKGAGVAGVASAASGARLGVRSVIIEREGSVLGRFAQCASRWVEPTHYDWPHDHWNRGSFTGLPLPYEARPAGALSWSWRGELAKLNRQGKTFVYTNVKELTHSYKAGAPPITIATSDVEFEFNEFDLMLDCTGPGDEICNVGAFEGFRFWQTDPFGKADLELSRGVVPKVLISGAGDGALQDFLRITTGIKSAGELLANLAGQYETTLRRFSHTAEDQARRRMAWCSTDAEKHAILKDLDATYQQAIDDLPTQEPELWNHVTARLDALVLPRVSDDRIIHVAHPCNHLNACYPLNRLLVHTVMKYLKPTNRFHFLQNSTTAAIDSSHTCGSPWVCHGRDHIVTFLGAGCGADPQPPSIPRSNYNVIVIRHGVQRHDRNGRPKHQTLPFYLSE